MIFPEAELRPPGSLGELGRGAAWLAARGGAQLLAVSVRVAARGHEAPEAYVDVVPVELDGDHVDGTARLADTLTATLADLDAKLLKEDPRRPLPGFRQVVRGRRSWDERLQRLPAPGRR